MDVSILAGRFAPLTGAFACDLGTGERVYLRVDRADGPELQRQWSERCAALSGLWHPSLAECLDFGLVSARDRFVAFRAARQSSARALPADWERARRDVETFLRFCGTGTGTQPQPFVDSTGRAVVVPDLGGAAGGSPEAPSPASWGFGIRLVRRAVLHAITELLTFDPPHGITVQQVEAALGSGGRTFLRHCAGEARRHGFVPMNTSVLRRVLGQPLARAWLSLLSAQHLVVLHDGRLVPFERRPELLRGLLRIATRGSRPRIVIELVQSREARSPLRLAPLDPRELVSMVVMPGTTHRQRVMLENAARRSRGRPGDFVERLLQALERRPPPGRAGPFTVHERHSEYARSPPESPPPPVHRHRQGRAARMGRDEGSGGVVRQACLLWRRGRRAAADRLLRQAGAASARREHWRAASQLAVARARLWRLRGRVGTAEESLHEAFGHAERAGDTDACVAAAIDLGALLQEDGRMEGAEGVLRSAVTGARLIGDATLTTWASLTLGTCVSWQGRQDEAHALLADPDLASGTARPSVGPPTFVPAPGPLGIWLECARARVALALGETAAAREHLLEASREASLLQEDDEGVRGLVLRLEAKWHSRVGDAERFEVATREAVRVATAARLPLDVLRASAGWLEGATALGRRPGTAAAVRRLERAARRRLPGLLAFRIRLALSRSSGTPVPDRLLAECRARGLAGLIAADRFFRADGRAVAGDTRAPMYEDVIEVMRICQEDGAADALNKVLQTVRDRTRAAVVDLATARRAGLAVVPCGARATCAARRAADSGIPIDPQGAESGYEAAVPLRFGGRLVGAIGCRWTAPPPLETGRLMGFLGAVAAAVAPCVESLDEPLAPLQAAAVGAELLGESAALQAIRQAVLRAADAPFPVLIQGESGSGKELVARAIHRASSRRNRPLCAVNCAALPDELLEAELFGHARGAFTGAVAERAGLFEEADGGVLFLDEVGELSPRAQAKLLRALQDGEVKRVGETFARRVDARIVAATNRALEQEVVAGRFRRDLRYRLDVIRIVVPPLRERPEDIPVLVEHFWRHAAERVGSRAKLGSGVLGTLVRYDWPGNVRELQNVLASLAVSASRRGVVGVNALPAVLASQAARGIDSTLDAARRVFEERFVRAALARSGGHRGRAAAELGLTRQGLSKLMGRLGMASAEVAASNRPPA